MTNRLSSLAIVALVIAITATACGSGDEPQLSSEEAHTLLDRAVDLTEAEDWDGLCLLTGDSRPRFSCLEETRLSDLPHPVSELAVIGERRLSESELVIVTCVETPSGAVRSEFYVLNYKGDIIAPNPVYWFPRTVTDANGGGGGISPVPTGQPTEAACPID